MADQLSPQTVLLAFSRLDGWSNSSAQERRSVSLAGYGSLSTARHSR